MAFMSNRKGSRRERELVRLLHDQGFAVMRAPASGGATDRELPDVLAGNGENFYAVEVKSSGKDVIYLTGEEVEGLTFFGRKFGAKVRIGTRFDRSDWRFIHPADLHVTDDGNYRVKRDHIEKHGASIDDL